VKPNPPTKNRNHNRGRAEDGDVKASPANLRWANSTEIPVQERPNNHLPGQDFTKKKIIGAAKPFQHALNSQFRRAEGGGPHRSTKDELGVGETLRKWSKKKKSDIDQKRGLQKKGAQCRLAAYQKTRGRMFNALYSWQRRPYRDRRLHRQVERRTGHLPGDNNILKQTTTERGAIGVALEKIEPTRKTAKAGRGGGTKKMKFKRDRGRVGKT